MLPFDEYVKNVLYEFKFIFCFYSGILLDFLKVY